MGQSEIVHRLREAAGHTVVYGLGSVAQRLLGFVLIPLYTRHYTAETFGVLSLVTIVASTAGAVCYLGGSSALSRSYFDYQDEPNRRAATVTAFRITVAGALLQCLLAVVASTGLSLSLFGTAGYSTHLTVALVGSALTFINAFFFVILRIHRNSTQIVVLNIASLILTTAFVLTLLLGMDLGVMAPILGTFLSELVILALLVVLNREAIRGTFSAHELKVQLQFGLPQIAIGLGYYALDSTDRFVLAKYSSLHEVGVYSLGCRIGMIIQLILIVPFSQIWTPMRMEYRHQSTTKDLSRLLLTYYFLVGGIAIVVISMFSRQLVQLLAGRADYFDAFQVVPLIMVGHLIYGAINILDAGIYFQRKVIYHVYLFAGIACLNATLCLLLIPRYGYLAAAWSKVVSSLVLVVAVHLVSKRFYPMVIEHGRVVAMAVSAGLVLVAGGMFNPKSVELEVLVKLLLIAGLVAGWTLFVLTRQERQGLAALIPHRWAQRN